MTNIFTVDNPDHTLQLSDGLAPPTREDLSLTALSETQWRVSDRRVPASDGACLRGFIEKVGDEFEVMQLGGKLGFSWATCATFSDAMAQFAAP